MIILILVWILRFILKLIQCDFNIRASYNALPSFHFREISHSGIMAGLLFSVGNYFLMISIISLGLSMGNCLSQTKVIVSGLWGIYFYKEINSGEMISKWLFFAAISLSGNFLLMGTQL